MLYLIIDGLGAMSSTLRRAAFRRSTPEEHAPALLRDASSIHAKLALTVEQTKRFGVTSPTLENGTAIGQVAQLVRALG